MTSALVFDDVVSFCGAEDETSLEGNTDLPDDWDNLTFSDLADNGNLVIPWVVPAVSAWGVVALTLLLLAAGTLLLRRRRLVQI
ncbi:MAG: IPTL-CTERM sorting domain-containing protein [Planctomycetes bacterium]|nr:IPTL-CTERM sorting domain-containing protein [Planctomycetota bacterium]